MTLTQPGSWVHPLPEVVALGLEGTASVSTHDRGLELGTATLTLCQS